jgi:hypothetical protein
VASEHIPVSNEMLKTINEKSAKLDLAWNLRIDNTGNVPCVTIVSMFQKLLQVK